MKHEQLIDTWWRVRDAFSDEYHPWVSFSHAARIREFLEHRLVDIPQFSYALYAYDLLAQTLHHHSLPSVSGLDFTREGTADESLGITGLLSTWGSRVCPAVLPTMLLYPESFFKRAIDVEYMIPDRRAEIETWLAHRQAFDMRVKEVRLELIRLSEGRHRDQENRQLTDAICEKYELEHSNLDAWISHDIRGNRIG